tara:strand:+ start:648 stop:1139 length:492 start_codon:yes stop_codon:yes gene_type:complete
MKLSYTLRAASSHATSGTHAGFLRACALEALQLEHATLDNDVRQAHVKFGTPAPPNPVQDIGRVDLAARKKLIREEFEEFMDAIDDGNMVGIIAEGVDVIYTILGTFVVLGVPFMPFWRLVSRANMAKVPAPGGGKWLKPDGWEAPDHAAELHRVRQQAEGVE